MRKQRRNITAAVRIGGVEILFGLVFLLLPLAFALKDKSDISEKGAILYYFPEPCVSEYKTYTFSGHQVFLDAPFGMNNRIPALLLFVLNADNSVEWIYNDTIIRHYQNDELLALKTDFQEFCTKLDTSIELATAVAPSSQAKYQNFISILEILKQYPNPAFGQPQIGNAF